MAEDEATGLRERVTRLERQLEEAQTIMDTLPIMFWYKDTQNRHVKINRSAAALEGMPVTAIEGKSAYDLYPREEASAYHRDDLEVINSGQPKLGIVEKHTRAGGEEMWLETGKVPVYDGTGAIVGVIAFAIDVTRQRRTQEFLRQTLETIGQMVERDAGRTELQSYLTQARAELEKVG